MFFSYSNQNQNYTQAVSLNNVQMVKIHEENSRSAIRFTVIIRYVNGSQENFMYLNEKESQEVYEAIVKKLNEE